MRTTGGAASVREAVAVFHDRTSFHDAVQDLLDSGFDRAELSLLAGANTVERKLGHAFKRVQELEDAPEVPRAAYVGNHSLAEGRTGIIGGLAYVGAMLGAGAVVASGGTLAATIAAAALAGGGGGMIGDMAARQLGRTQADAMQRQLERGGLLLWVQIRDGDHERRARDILARHGGEDIHVHELPLGAASERNPLSDIEFDPWLPGAKL